MVGLAFLAGMRVVDKQAAAAAASRAVTMALVSEKAGDVLHETQREQGRSSLFMSSHGAEFGHELAMQRQTTDAIVAEFDRLLDESSGQLPLAVRTSAGMVRAALDELGALRARVDALQVEPGLVIDDYSALDRKIRNMIAVVAVNLGESSTAVRLQAYIAFLTAKEAASKERAQVSNVLMSGRFSDGQFVKVANLIATQQDNLTEFERIAPADVLQRWNLARATPPFGQVASYEKTLLALPPGGSFGIDPAVWFDTMTAKIDEFKKVEDYQADAIVAEARSAHHEATSGARVTMAMALLLLMVTGTLTLAVGRSIVRPLRRLTRAAATVADDAFTEPARVTDAVTPDGPAPQQLTSIEVSSGDELAELAAAFNTMSQHLQAKAREQKHIQEMIAGERDFVDSVLDAAGSLVLVLALDRRGRIIRFNRACETTTGYRSAEVEGKLVSELFLLPEEANFAAAGFGEDTASTPELALPRSFVCTWISRAGERHHIAWSNAALVDGYDEVTHVIATGIDITASRAAETGLREVQERFRLAFHNAPIGMCLVSMDGRFIKVNRALCDMLGRAETELLRLSIPEVTHPDDVGAAIAAMVSMRTGQRLAHRAENRYLHADGRVIWALMSASVVHRDSGEPFYYLTQMQDITEHRAVEERLAHQAMHDPLTGLPNRTLLIDRLQLELDRSRPARSDRPALRRPRRIQDGQRQSWPRRRRPSAARSRPPPPFGIHSSDTVARLGGDEFVILCQDVPNRHVSSR